MSELILNIRQRKALRPFVVWNYQATYSAATQKHYLDGDSTMRWKPDAPTYTAPNIPRSPLWRLPMDAERINRPKDPETFEEAVTLAEWFAQDACEHAKKATGESVRYERRGNSFFIIWPDGEETNRIDVDWVQ